MKKRESECPVCQALDVFGDKWSLLVIRDLIFGGCKTYTDFLEGGEGISTNILADRLRSLEAEGLISKRAHPENKVKYIYELTEKGIALVPAMLEMIAWAADHVEGVHPDAKLFSARLKTDRDAVIKETLENLRENTASFSL
jgi:DNA-binding HxlR family transcriptional regulator